LQYDAQAPPLVTRPIRQPKRRIIVAEDSLHTPQARAWAISTRMRDGINLLLVVGMWGLLLLLVPPAHEFPIIDDWNHASAVRHMLQIGKFDMPPTMQANLFGLVVWGASWSKVFGFSFTTLTYSTLVLELGGLLAFYGLARSVGVRPWGALFGTALLAFNPIWVHLSYSFMTDVPFVSLMLIACFLYVQGIQRGFAGQANAAWLLMGGFFAGWAFTIRQFGLLIPLAFILYLVFVGITSRKWRWLDMLAIAAVPAVVMGGWWLWRHDLPQTAGAAASAGRAANFLFKEPWVRVPLLRALVLLPVAALSAWGAIKLARNRLWLLAPVALVVIVCIYTLDLPGERWIEMYEPPFTVQLGPLSTTIPAETFTFAQVGNIIRIGGIDFFEYNHQRIWSREAWQALWFVGIGLGILLLTKIVAGLIDWGREFWAIRRERPVVMPRMAVYMLGAFIFVISMTFQGDMYDRYLVQFLPFLLLFVVRGSSSWGRWAWGYSVAALVVVSSFTVVAKMDHMDHARARWEAGQWLIARSGGIHGGYDWDNWVGNRNDNYQITDWHIEGYRTEKTFPYFNRLGGFTTRYVLAESRQTMPPLPAVDGSR
jgi:hypothetical protein